MNKKWTKVDASLVRKQRQGYYTCIRSFPSLLQLLYKVVIQILPVLNASRCARNAHEGWVTAMAASARSEWTASVDVPLTVCQVSSLASAWYLFPRIPSVATSMQEGLAIRLYGNSMLTRSTYDMDLLRFPVFHALRFKLL